MTSEVEELQNIAVSIMRTSKINVIINNSLETAMTDYKNIYVTIKLVPQELRKFKRVVSRVLDGEVAHEAGHIVITAPVKQAEMKWIQQQRYKELANVVHQCIEDKRVNHYILYRYRFDFAFRLQLLADVSNRLWLDTLKMKIAKKRSSGEIYVMKPESFFVQEMLISIAAMKGIWDIPVEEEFEMTAEQEAFMAKTKAIFDEARFDKMTMSILNRHQQLYNLWETQLQKTGEDARENTPASIGGGLSLESGAQTRKALSQMEKKLKKAEEEAEEEAKKENKKRKDLPTDSMGAGTGSGLNIPTPYPDEPEYTRLAQQNREHIERLLNLLKRLALPKIITQRFVRQGRFMTEILSKAVASSNRRDVQDVYSHRSIALERAEACIGLLVDLSGSVSVADAKDSLTTISEVCGRWLRDEDFAIMVFGSDFQKIKAFVEPYHTTKVRIGGVEGLGGTVLLAPLGEMYQMVKAQRNGRAKILMIVSDFDVDKPDECKKLIKQIEKDEINVIGLGIDNSSVAKIKQFCREGRYIGNITELPEAVFELYREVAF